MTLVIEQKLLNECSSHQMFNGYSLHENTDEALDDESLNFKQKYKQAIGIQSEMATQTIDMQHLHRSQAIVACDSHC